MKSSQLCIVIGLLLAVSLVRCKKFTKEEKPEWAKKDIRDFSEADMERLLEQWEASTRNFMGNYCTLT
jgi:hypothetical protein